MPRLRPLRLASLRRAPSFALLMVLVFLMRIGITIACEPHEFAELFAANAVSTLSFDAEANSATGSEDDDRNRSGEPAPDHCQQCSCHHGVTLTSSRLPMLAVTHARVAPLLAIALADALPDRELRPPIV